MTRGRFRHRLVAGLVAAWSAGLAMAAAGQFATGVNLVEVYATVTDASGAPVPRLTRDDFTIFEDGEPQTVTAFTAGDFPLALAIAIDRSFSMAERGRLDAARRAITAFVDELGPEDRVMLLAIGSEVEEVSPLSSDRIALKRAVASLTPWGTTSLNDAIVAGIDRIQPHTGRRGLVVLSDGADRFSRASAADALERARRADVLVYPIALGSARPPLFAELAVATGGRSAHVPDPRALSGTLDAVARELRTQYLLGYTPTRPIREGEAGWRTIRVTVRRPDLRVRARDGYLAK
jgi:Ca-activated chloride channel homolog